MKRLAIILGIVTLSGIWLFPAHAMRHGMDGGGMMGNWGSVLMEWFQKWQNRDRYDNPAEEDGRQTGRPGRRFYEQSWDLKNRIQVKEKELEALLSSDHPEIEKVRAVHREIGELRSRLAEAERNVGRGSPARNPEDRWHGRNGPGYYGPPGNGGTRGRADSRPVGGCGFGQ